jgi:succinoglycan biosynthesis transport protein ExoP
MTFQDYLNMALKHWKMIFISTILCTAIGIAACFLVPKVYEANGKLLISQDNMSIMGDASPLEDMMLSSLGKSDPITTQMEIIKTRPILMKVIDTLHLRDKDSVLLDPEDFVSIFKISNIRSTNLIEIKCQYNNADSAALIVNTLAQVFVDKNQQMNQEIIKTAKDFIGEQLVGQKLKVEEAEQKLIEFKEKSKTMSLDKETEVNIESYSNLNLEYVKAQSDLDAAVKQQKVYKTKIATLRSESNPLYQVWVASSEQIENATVGLTAKRDALKKQLDVQKDVLKGMPSTEAQLIGLLREQKVSSEIYTSLLSKFEEYKVQEIAKIGSAKIIEPAVSPLKPVIPKKKILLLLSFALGLSIGLSLAFGIEYLRGLPHSVEEIKKALGYSVLGVVPYQESIKKSFFTRDNPSSIQSEAIRLIQTSIKFRVQESDQGGTVILVTSTQPGEGKSTIAANLAYSYSSNKKTLLMGMDFRKPSFDRVFGEPMNPKGITDAFDSMTELHRAIKSFTKLDVIGPGSLPSNPLDLVQSKRMGVILETLRKEYEVIIIDTAPITMVAETSELVKLADTVVVVVDMSSVSLKNLHGIKSNFDGKSIIPGVIVNKFQAPNAQYYKYAEYT